MWRILLVALALAGCTQLPPSPHEIQAKRFEPAASGMSVIYIMRDYPDNDLAATIVLDGAASITTYPGTFYRWEVPPGRHRITGMAADPGAITLQTEPGRIYFVQQGVEPVRAHADVTFLSRGRKPGPRGRDAWPVGPGRPVTRGRRLFAGAARRLPTTAALLLAACRVPLRRRPPSGRPM